MTGPSPARILNTERALANRRGISSTVTFMRMLVSLNRRKYSRNNVGTIDLRFLAWPLRPCGLPAVACTHLVRGDVTIQA